MEAKLKIFSKFTVGNALIYHAVTVMDIDRNKQKFTQTIKM